MKGWFEGAFIVTVKVNKCKEADTYILYKPSERSDYHSEILKSKDEILLTKAQARKLAKFAKLYFVQKNQKYHKKIVVFSYQYKL